MSIQQILVVDDEESILTIIVEHLQGRGYLVKTCRSGEEALDLLRKESFELVLTDLKMRGLNGVELCDRIVSNYPTIPVLVMTAFGALDVAIEAIRAGAYDFLVKPLQFEQLALTVEKAMRDAAARLRMREIESNVPPLRSEVSLLGENRSILDLRATISRIADLDTSVIISGESGTGKALVSEALHRSSQRKDEPYVVVNCTTLTEGTFERDLFGSVDTITAGSASESFGAVTRHEGLVGAARGGTLFFDEIGHLPLPVQSKLLRLFEERLYRPVGDLEERYCPARFVVATNSNLQQAVKDGAFREDLFFRINVLHFKIPPLRERGNDVLLLAHFFLVQFSKKLGKDVQSLSDPVTERLARYSWPGNVRELRNVIERAVALARYDQIIVEDLPEEIRNFRKVDIFRAEGREELIPIDEVEQRHILGVLKELNGNKALAAKVLGMDRKTLYRKLERYGYTEG